MNADVQPVGEYPPVAWWQCENVDHAEWAHLVAVFGEKTARFILWSESLAQEAFN